MKKTELITAIAEKSGLTKKDAEAALTATLDTIVETVAAGDKIQITGFGTFEQRQRNAEWVVTQEQVTRLKFLLLKFLLSRPVRNSRIL